MTRRDNNYKGTTITLTMTNPPNMLKIEQIYVLLNVLIVVAK